MFSKKFVIFNIFAEYAKVCQVHLKDPFKNYGVKLDKSLAWIVTCKNCSLQPHPSSDMTTVT